MKQKYIYTISFLLTIAAVFSACSKEEVGPTLIVHAQEADGTAAAGADIRVWYAQPGDCNNPPCTLNDEGYDQRQNADGAGDAIFKFDASAVLDVDIIYFKNTVDTLGNPTVDTLYGHKVVKIEAVRQSSDDNNFDEIVIVK